jgi:hypothetical protein
VTHRRRIKICAIAGIALAAQSCGAADDRKEAESIAGLYFDAVAAQRPSDALDQRDSQFFWTFSREAILARLNEIRTRCGLPTAHALTSWKVQRFGTDSARTSTLVYDVQYTSCRTSETIMVQRPDGGGKARLFGLYISIQEPAAKRSTPLVPTT